jgi:hypothetical protein
MEGWVDPIADLEDVEKKKIEVYSKWTSLQLYWYLT